MTEVPAEPPRLPAVALPALFVVLWSTGYIFSRLGLPYADPFTFLAVRLAIAASLLLAFALLTRAPWPASGREGGHIVAAGLLLHGGYLVGVFEAIRFGVPTGIVALVAALQPILTGAAAGPLLGERVSARQWMGLALGFAGVAMVVWERLGAGAERPVGYAFAVLCLVSITAGTLYQKRFCQHLDLRSGTALQFAATAAALAVGAMLFETREIAWTVDFAIALAWLVLVLSLGSISVLFVLIRRGAATRVTSLFYLVPPMTAVLGFAAFGETLSALALAGMGIAVLGVALVNR